MADPKGMTEIEDVLSSIRRLVAAETRKVEDAPPRPAEPLDDALVLTPAQRVDAAQEPAEPPPPPEEPAASATLKDWEADTQAELTAASDSADSIEATLAELEAALDDDLAQDDGEARISDAWETAPETAPESDDPQDSVDAPQARDDIPAPAETADLPGWGDPSEPDTVALDEANDGAGTLAQDGMSPPAAPGLAQPGAEADLAMPVPEAYDMPAEEGEPETHAEPEAEAWAEDVADAASDERIDMPPMAESVPFDAEGPAAEHPPGALAAEGPGPAVAIEPDGDCDESLPTGLAPDTEPSGLAPDTEPSDLAPDTEPSGLAPDLSSPVAPEKGFLLTEPERAGAEEPADKAPRRGFIWVGGFDEQAPAPPAAEIVEHDLRAGGMGGEGGGFALGDAALSGPEEAGEAFDLGEPDVSELAQPAPAAAPEAPDPGGLDAAEEPVWPSASIDAAPEPAAFVPETAPTDPEPGAMAEDDLLPVPDTGEAEAEADIPGLFDTTEEMPFDEAALRDLVAEIIRDELRGVLGERIGRNLRKLVRHEIEAALARRGDG